MQHIPVDEDVAAVFEDLGHLVLHLLLLCQLNLRHLGHRVHLHLGPEHLQHSDTSMKAWDCYLLQ